MDSPKAQAIDRIVAVESALAGARAKWSSLGASIGSYFGSPKDQVLSALSQMETLGIVPWKNRINKLALTDQAGWNRWVKDGNDLLKNLADTAQDSEQATIQGIVAATVQATAKDTKKLVKKVAHEAVQTVKLGAVGLVAVAVIVVAVWLFLKFKR